MLHLVRMLPTAKEIQVSSRVPRALYDKILKRRTRAKKLTGIEPSVSEVVRAMLEEAASK